LLRQLPSLMPELPDEHKIVIVDSVRELVAKYRHKHQAVINALSGLMRDGGYEFKKTLVETILFIMKEVPESKESALTQLCEFIEDCEFPGMTARIIHLLGTEGPRTLNPSRYIRHIYNRIILESPQVRASAVQALTKFGVLLPELKPRIVSLLKRCLIDNDDEVRDRATLCLHLLQQEDAKALKLILPEVDVPLVNLKRALVQYIEQHAQSKQVAPFDVSTVSREQIVEKKEKKENKAVPDNVAQKQLLSIQQANAAVSVDVVQQKNEELEAKIEAFQRQFKVGALSHTSKNTDLTEAETEFVVSCVKHFFAKHVLFQFNVRNTLNDQVIDNVSVEMVPDEDAEGFKVEAVLEATRVGCGETRAVWLLLHRPSSAVPVTASFHNTLKFTTKDYDATSGEVDDSGMPDQYQIEDAEISLADYIKGTNVEEFAARWEELGEEHECTETFSLSNAKSLQDAVKDILDFLGMTPQEKSEVVPAKRTKHAMFLAGEYLGGVPLLARVRMQIPPSGGVGVQLCIRSTDAELSAAIAGAMFA
jgi:coatomer protein complex subunit gamma